MVTPGNSSRCWKYEWSCFFWCSVKSLDAFIKWFHTSRLFFLLSDLNMTAFRLNKVELWFIFLSFFSGQRPLCFWFFACHVCSFQNFVDFSCVIVFWCKFNLFYNYLFIVLKKKSNFIPLLCFYWTQASSQWVTHPWLWLFHMTDIYCVNNKPIKTSKWACLACCYAEKVCRERVLCRQSI